MRARAPSVQARNFRMRERRLSFGWLWLVPSLAGAAPNPRLVLPEFSALAQKAKESVHITLDSSLLAMAGRFLDGNDPQDAATKEVLKGLQGIYVRSYTFDQDAAYR